MQVHQLIHPRLGSQFNPSAINFPNNRREGYRVRTVYRVVRVETGDQQGSARLRNMSDGGMKLTHHMSLMIGDIVRVALTEQTELEGTVVWTKGDDCGVKFLDQVDSIAILRQTAEQYRLTGIRSPGMRAKVCAVAST